MVVLTLSTVSLPGDWFWAGGALRCVSVHVQAGTAKLRRKIAPRLGTAPNKLRKEVRSSFLKYFNSCLAGCFCVDTFVSVESAPPPETTSVKKSKAVSSSEEEDKEVFLLHVSKTQSVVKIFKVFYPFWIIFL